MKKKILQIIFFLLKINYNLVLTLYRSLVIRYFKKQHFLVKKKIIKTNFFVKFHKKLVIENFIISGYFSKLRHYVTYQYLKLNLNKFLPRKLNINQKHLLQKDSNKIIFSIIIPTHKNRMKLFSCIKSIINQRFNYIYEIIVVDDYEQSQFKPYFLGSTIVCIKNKKNLGFIGSCNLGAKKAKGKYLYFLNDDTIIFNADTINSLIETADQDSKIGIVGSKILLNRSTLQEAGCLTFKSGKCYQFGKHQNQFQDIYNFVNEVDYCSGCSLLIPRNLFKKILFDKRYSPAYYEDVDLAFSVRYLGYKVVYQPRSVLLHFEGSSTGINTKNDVKQYQYRNQEIFRKKWAHQLTTHQKHNEIVKSKIRKPIVIIIDEQIPDADRDAGSLIPLFFIKYYQKKGCQIILFASNLDTNSKIVKKLQDQGVFVTYGLSSLIKYSSILKDQIKFIIVLRILLLKRHYKLISKLSDKIIFHYVDLHHLRLERESKLKLFTDKDEINKIRTLETDFIKHNYLNITVSSEEQLYLKNNFDLNTKFVPLYYPRKNFKNLNILKKVNKNSRLSLAFIGSYNHEPNIDAVNYFVKNVYPLLSKRLKTTLYLIGPNKERILNLESKNVFVTGKIENLNSILNKVDIAISPLRYGAGTKGKILTYAMHNLPVICSKISVEGTDFQDSKDCIIVDPEDANKFVDAIEKVFLEKKLKFKLSKNLNNKYIEKYSFDKGFEYLDTDFRFQI